MSALGDFGVGFGLAWQKQAGDTAPRAQVTFGDGPSPKTS